MAIIDKNALDKLNAANKALTSMQTPISEAPTQGDWLDKVERIINGVDNLMENITKLHDLPLDERRQLLSGSRGVLDSPRRQPAPTDHRPVEQRAESAGDRKGSDIMSKIGKTILPKVADYLDQCIAENPNMTIAEAIDKIPLNVTQLRGLLELLKTVL